MVKGTRERSQPITQANGTAIRAAQAATRANSGSPEPRGSIDSVALSSAKPTHSTVGLFCRPLTPPPSDVGSSIASSKSSSPVPPCAEEAHHDPFEKSFMPYRRVTIPKGPARAEVLEQYAQALCDEAERVRIRSSGTDIRLWMLQDGSGASGALLAKIKTFAKDYKDILTGNPKLLHNENLASLLAVAAEQGDAASFSILNALACVNLHVIEDPELMVHVAATNTQAITCMTGLLVTGTNPDVRQAAFNSLLDLSVAPMIFSFMAINTDKEENFHKATPESHDLQLLALYAMAILDLKPGSTDDPSTGLLVSAAKKNYQSQLRGVSSTQ